MINSEHTTQQLRHITLQLFQKMKQTRPWNTTNSICHLPLSGNSSGPPHLPGIIPSAPSPHLCPGVWLCTLDRRNLYQAILPLQGLMLGRFAGSWVLLEMIWCVKGHMFHVSEVIYSEINIQLNSWTANHSGCAV